MCPYAKNILLFSLILHIKISWRKYKKTFFFYFNMKISQKSVSLRCRVLVKNKRLCSVLAAEKDACIESIGVRSRRMHLFLLHVGIFKYSKPHAPFFPYGEAGKAGSVPAEVDLPWTVGPLLNQWLMEFTSCPRVDVRPTKLTVILQASDIGTKKGSKFATAPGTLAFITHLVIQHVWLYLHLFKSKTKSTEENNLIRLEQLFRTLYISLAFPPKQC